MNIFQITHGGGHYIWDQITIIRSRTEMLEDSHETMSQTVSRDSNIPLLQVMIKNYL